MAYTSNNVRLWDRLVDASENTSNGSNGLLLHPETELAAVIMTTDGVIVSSGNELSLDIDSAWSGGISAHVESEYCPKVTADPGGSTSMTYSSGSMYADMFVSGTTGTVTPVPTSTGYGTLINALSTTTEVRSAYAEDSATNDYIPTERAVALALEGKQQVLSGGACIDITSGANYTDVSVRIQSNVPLPALDVAVQSKVPTEYVVRHAVDTGDIACSNYAYGLVSGLDAAIKASGYATSAWVTNNFVGNTDYATTTDYGIVRAPVSKGITIANGDISVSAAGVVDTYDSAATLLGSGAVGGVIVTNVIASGTSDGTVDQTIMPVVPTTDAVYKAIQAGGGGGGKPISSGGGIEVVDSTTHYVITLNNAGTVATEYGGVYVPSGSGLAVNAGELKLQPATSGSGAVVGTLGGVVCGYGLQMSGTNSDTIRLRVAGSNFIGGVQVPKSSGLTLNYTDGTLVLSQAPVGAAAVTYASAVTSMNAGGIGGVFALNHLESAANTTHAGKAVVPTVDAVCAAHGVYTPFYAKTSKVNTSSASFQLNAGQIFDSNYNLLYDYNTPGKFFVSSGGDARVLYAHTLLDASNNLSAIVNIVESSASYIDTIPIAKAVWDNTTNNAVVTQYTAGNIVFKGSAGGKPVSQGDGITVTDNTTSYTVAVTPATTASIGGVIVGNGLSVAADGTIAVTATGGIDSFTVTKGTGINVTGASATGCTVGVLYQDPISANGSTLALKYDSNKLTVSGGALTLVDGAVTGGYAGPFAAASTGGTTASMTVAVNGGYVKWLDGNTWVPSSDAKGSRWTLSSALSNTTSGWVYSSGGSWYTPDKTALYLVGSSGAVAGQAITAHTYSATVGGVVYTRTESSNDTTSRFKWTSGTGNNIVSMWADQNLGLDTVAYDADTGTTSIGTVTDYKGTITVGGVAYVKSSTDTDETGAWLDANGNAQYTASAWPLSGQNTLYTISEKFGYATSQGDLPPAGAFYTMLAQNQSGAIVQQQYGTVWHEHWGDDYKGQFAISRVALQTMSAQQLPTKNTYPYAYVIGRGGRMYGGIPFNQGRFWGGIWRSGSLIIPPSDIWYPMSNVSGTSKNDALYFKYGTVNEVWLNIWSGTWPTTYGGTEQTAVNDMWYVVAHPDCLEGKIQNCYSVQLGWVTGNGAPQQEHKGAIAIRGRWA